MRRWNGSKSVMCGMMQLNNNHGRPSEVGTGGFSSIISSIIYA
jgi:hypothetical protein